MAKRVTRNGILKPRNLKGILGEIFKVYGRNFLKLLAIVAIVEVILGAIWLILGTVFDFASLPHIVAERKLESLTSPIIITGIVMLVVSIVASILMLGALIHAVVEQYRRQTVTIADAYAFARGRLGAMTGAGFLAFLAISAIIAVCVYVVLFSWVGWILVAVGIPAAIYFAVRWTFIWQTASLERVGPMAALVRSSALVKGNWWRVLGIMLLVGLITAAIGAAVTSGITVTIRATAPINAIATSSAAAAINAALGKLPAVVAIIGSVLSTPVLAVGGTLLYYDLWVRKEDFTLEFLDGGTKISNDVS